MVVLMRRMKECKLTSLEIPRKISRLKVLRGEGRPVEERSDVDPELGRIDECLGGHLANPMWRPGHLFDGSEAPELWIPDASGD